MCSCSILISAVRSKVEYDICGENRKRISQSYLFKCNATFPAVKKREMFKSICKKHLKCILKI